MNYIMIIICQVIMIIVCQVISQDKVIKWSNIFMVRKVKINHHLAKFGGLRYCGSGEKLFSYFQMILHDHVTQWLCVFVCWSSYR